MNDQNKEWDVYYCKKCHHRHFCGNEYISHRKYSKDDYIEINTIYACNKCDNTYQNKSSLTRHNIKIH